MIAILSHFVNLFRPVDCHCSMTICSLLGGELFDYLIEKEYLSEKDATCYVWELLEIMNYLHQKQICHLDLKVGMQKDCLIALIQSNVIFLCTWL